MKYISLFLIVHILSACVLTTEPSETPESVQGFIPIYGDVNAAEVSFLTPRTVKSPGKIYTYGSYLLINEVNKGIHVYENSNPANPQPLGFIEIVGNTDMAIRNNVLYANHMGSLLALNIADFTAPQKVGEVTISRWQLGVPPPSQNYFECVDPAKGVVIGWKSETLKNPACYAH